MTFVQVSEWQIAERPHRRHLADATYSALPDWATTGLTRGLAVAGSIMIHLLLLYILVTKVFGGEPPPKLAHVKAPSLLLFNLNDAPPDKAEGVAPEPPPQADAAQDQAQSTTQEPPSEWKAMKLPRAPTINPTRSGISNSGATSRSAPNAGSWGNGSGGGGYDPYAGAAPQYLMPRGMVSSQPPAVQGPVLPTDPIKIDAATLEKIRSMTGPRVGSKIPARVVVRIAKNGSLIELTISGVAAAIEAQMRTFLKNNPLYSVSGRLDDVQIRTIDL